MKGVENLESNNISTWVEDGNGWHFCESCGNESDMKYNFFAQHYYEHLSKFCPNCGKEMANGGS